MVTFDSGKPVDGSFLVSEDVRSNFQAVSRANDLRPQPGLEVDDDPANSLRIFVNSGRYATDGQSTKTFIGQQSPVFVAPTTDNRIDVLYISLGGTLSIIQGTEAASPIVPNYPADSTSIAEVTLFPGMTEITEDDFVDARPMFVISAAGFGINPAEESFTGDGVTAVFNLTSFTYAPGQSELNVFVGGVRKESGNDFTESGITQITFVNPPPAGVNIIVWKVGAASAHNLSDLDDVSVAVAEAVTDPDSVRTTTADRTNPFATLADVTGAVPFDIEHDGVTGAHGPRVNITQPNADRALSIEKTSTSTGVALNVVNSGTDAGVFISQVGAGIALDTLQSGASTGWRHIQNGGGLIADLTQNTGNIGVRITHNNSTVTALPLSIQRATSAGVHEPLINLRDIGNSNGANISFHNNQFSIADQATNTRKLTLNTSTGSLSLTAGSDVNRLIVTKASGSAAAASFTTSAGSGTTLLLTNNAAATGAALRIANAGSGADMTVDSIGAIDALWGGPASNADTLHTHASIPENLTDLDVSNNESAAFFDSGSKRESAISAANPLAALADIEEHRAKVAVGAYTGNASVPFNVSTQVFSEVAGGLVSFDPDWVMIYNTADNTRSGAYVHSGASNGRFFNATGAANISTTTGGFTLSDNAAEYNQVGIPYVFIAIAGNPTA